MSCSPVSANLGNLERALELLDCIIDENPKYASAFNNRAQIKRLLQRDEDAMMDLGMAIELTHEKGWCKNTKLEIGFKSFFLELVCLYERLLLIELSLELF